MRAYRYATYSALLGSGASLLYNCTVLPGLLFGISAGTMAGFVENRRQNKTEVDDKTLIKVWDEISWWNFSHEWQTRLRWLLCYLTMAGFIENIRGKMAKLRIEDLPM